jgi:hypothetical protein
MMISLNLAQKKARSVAGLGICTAFTQVVHDDVARVREHRATNHLNAYEQQP